MRLIHVVIIYFYLEYICTKIEEMNVVEAGHD